MNLNADSGGFLVGSERVDLSGEQDKLQILRAIKADTAAMRAALGQSNRKAAQAATPAAMAQAVRSAVRRREAANHPLEPVAARARGVRQREAADGSAPRPAATRRQASESSQGAASVARPNRAANGRFLSAAERNAMGADGGGERENGRVSRLLGKVGDMAGKLRDGMAGMFSGTEQVDPAIAAAKEVGEITAPLMAPITGVASALFKPRNEQADQEKTEKKITVPWYRRLWQQLRDLNEKSGGQASGGKFSMGSLLKKLPGAALLGSLLGKLGGSLLGDLDDPDRKRGERGTKRGGANARAGRLGARQGRAGGTRGLASSAKPLMTSVRAGIKPLMSVLARAALPLAAMFSAVKSFSTSTEEYAARMGVELNGSLAQELGVRFVGVLGDLGNTLTFGLAGKFGEFIAPAVSTMVEGIVSKWGATTAWIETKWSDMTGKFDGVIDGIRKWFADKFGSVADKVKNVGATVSNKVSDVKESASSWVSQKTDAVASAFGGGSKGRKQALQAEMTNAGITDPREQAMFMAQMDHESGGFMASEESFKYRDADRLMAVSGSARKKGKGAVEAAMKQGPEAIAELMYGGRMGNTEKGDGYKFRGRGAIQLTGKDNYAAASKDLGIDLMGNPDLAADPAVAAKVATWYWKKNKLGDAARKGDVTGVTKKINGGTNGLADRESKYKAYLAAANSGKLSIGTDGVASKNVSPTAIPLAGSKIEAPAAEPLDFQAREDARMLAEARAPIVTSKAVAINEGGLRAIQRGAISVAPTAQPKVATAPAVASAAPPADRQTVPPAPSVPRKVASNESKAQQPVVIEQPLSQNLADRGLAQAATGGLGMNIGGR